MKLKQVDLILLATQVLVFVLLLITWLSSEVPLQDLLRDTAIVASVPFYYGFFSNLGILFWCASAVIPLFSAVVLFPVKQERATSAFLLGFGLISLLLTLDDFFLLHEKVFPMFLRLSESRTYMLYAALVIYALLRFRKVILKTNLKPLLLALLLFAMSLALDFMLPVVRDGKYWLKSGEKFLLEDGVKLLGITAWCFYLVNCSLAAVRRQFGNQTKATPSRNERDLRIET